MFVLCVYVSGGWGNIDLFVWCVCACVCVYACVCACVCVCV